MAQSNIVVATFEDESKTYQAFSEIKRAAAKEGMRFLRECAVERMMLGLTTLREINKVTFVE